MVRTTNIVALIVFLVILSIILTVCFVYKDNVEVIKESRNFPNKTVIYDANSFEDDRFVYLVCGDDKLIHDWRCKIMQEKFPYKDAARSCNVTLSVVGATAIVANVSVLSFGENKAILMWKQNNSAENEVKISVIHLDDCRQTSDVKLHDSRLTFDWNSDRVAKKIVTYNNSFDIFYEDSSRCNDKECKLTVDDDGQVTGPDPLIYNNGYNVSDVYYIANYSPAKAYVYSKSNGNEADVFLMLPDGTEKQLKSLTGRIKMSVVNGSIGVCSKAITNPNITCSQYNVDGELKLNFTLTDVNNKTHLWRLYTSSDGNLLLNFVDFCKDLGCNPPPVRYSIVKVNSAGKQIGRFRFRGIEKRHQGIDQTYVWKNRDKEGYCALILPSKHYIHRFEILVNCFTDADFLVQKT